MIDKKIRIIPRLDIKGENVVKGVHLEGLRVLGSPSEFASRYYESGADEIIFMDSVASLYGRNNLHQIVSSVAEKIFIPMTVGGGVRSLDDVNILLRSGADKISINTALFSNPNLVYQVSDHFGSQCMVVSIDVVKKDTGKYECLTDNGREKTGVELFEWLEQVVDLGAGEILLTSVDREGTGKGCDVDLINSISTRCPLPLIVCGGIGSKEDVLSIAKKGNVDAISASSIFHYKLAKDFYGVHSTKVGNKDFLIQLQKSNKQIRKGINPVSIHELKRYLCKNKINLSIRQ